MNVLQILAAAIGFAGALVVPWESAMAVEKPTYSVIAKHDGYEVREYAPYIVAETRVSGGQRRADNSGFRILAGYIFGNNMGSGVASRQRAEPEKIAMTAPVISEAVDDSDYFYRFVMPSKYTLETLPKPIDKSIVLREVPARVVAVRRFSGRWREESFDKHRTLLEEALARDGLDTVGAPMLARYNAPFIPGFMRRNEVMFELDAVPSETVETEVALEVSSVR